MKRTGLSDKSFDILNKIFLTLIVVIIVYPLVFVISASISNPVAVSSGKMWLWPVDITFEGYKRILQDSSIWLGYRNTIIYTTDWYCNTFVCIITMCICFIKKRVNGT